MTHGEGEGKMDLFVVDFEKQFEKHMKEWMDRNRNKYKKAEEMEAQVEKVYERWLETPAPWLDGATPMTYFKKFDDPGLLIKWMIKYVTAGIWVPDPMLDRIVELGAQAEALLLKVKRREIPLPAGERGDEAVLIAIKLLSEIGSVQPMEEYIEAIVKNPDNDYAESMAEALIGMGREVVDAILKKMEALLDPQALEWFMSVLVEFPGDERVFKQLLNAYKNPENDRAVLAAYLGKYGNPAAIPALKEALVDGALNYLEWTETRNAIEELGGEANVSEPDFSGDPWYESLRFLD
jgi:hypothetical protein